MIANIIFLGACWLFLFAVIGSIALRCWHERERRDAAETARVLNTLLHDRTNDHIYDA